MAVSNFSYASLLMQLPLTCKARDNTVGMACAQFNEVQSAEIPQIAAACAELGESAGERYAPMITFSAPALAPACAGALNAVSKSRVSSSSNCFSYGS